MADFTCGDQLEIQERLSGSIKMEFIDKLQDTAKNTTYGVYRITNAGENPINIPASDWTPYISSNIKNIKNKWYLLRLDTLWELDLKAQQNGWKNRLSYGATGAKPPTMITINPNEYHDFISVVLTTLADEHHAYRVYHRTEEGYFILSEPYCLFNNKEN